MAIRDRENYKTEHGLSLTQDYLQPNAKRQVLVRTILVYI